MDGQVALQAPFAAAAPGDRRRTARTPTATTSKKSMVLVNWALPEIDRPLAADGHQRALVLPDEHAGLAAAQGAGRFGAGRGRDRRRFGAGLRQATFSAGLKGIRAEDAPQVEALILATLEQLAAEGFEPDMVEAAVNTIEFSPAREQHRVLPAWAEPVHAVAARVALRPRPDRAAWVTSCRWPWSSGGWPPTRCSCSKLIQTYLLDNTPPRHRAARTRIPNAAAGWRPRKRIAWPPPRPP